jgi:site-specific DNA-adenine methylase
VKLTNKGVHCLLSNSNTAIAKELYKGFNIQEVDSTHVIGARASSRKQISEILVNNY